MITADVLDDAFLDSVGMVREGYEFTVRELRGAFERVEPPENWKNPIDADIVLADERDLALIVSAVLFMTGSHAAIEALGCRRFRVTAAGYYVAIGA